VDERGRDKNKFANGGRRAENEIRDNYQFILPVRASHFRYVSKTVSTPEVLGHRCNQRTCRIRHGILDASRKFCRKILFVALGFLSGVIAFYSGLIITMTWSHYSVPLGLNLNVSSFQLMLSFMILAATSIMATVVLKNGVPTISGICRQASILSTMKSTGMKEFLILTGISSTIPTGRRID
jgi:hypothetical protein